MVTTELLAIIRIKLKIIKSNIEGGSRNVDVYMGQSTGTYTRNVCYY